jgi:hypothetical protein
MQHKSDLQRLLLSREHLSSNVAARILGVTDRQVRNLANTGRISAIRSGIKIWAFPLRCVLELAGGRGRIATLRKLPCGSLEVLLSPCTSRPRPRAECGQQHRSRPERSGGAEGQQ